MATPNVKLDIKSNIKQFTKGLNKVGKSQIPFALNKSIANTVFKLKDVGQKEMVKKIDRPTKYTQNSIRYEAPKNKKALPIGYVYFTPEVTKYLKYSIEGGMRPYKKGRVLPTTNSRLDAFGNVPQHRNIISKSRAMNNRFVTDKGIFQRKKGGRAKLLYIFEKRALKYKKIFPFYETMIKRSGKIFDYYFKNNLTKAIDKTNELIAKGVLR